MSDVQLQLKATDCWDALVDLLTVQLSNVEGQPNVDVQPVTDKDFDGEDLVLNPPSVRVMYSQSKHDAFESQKRNYEATHGFLAICGDTDLRSSTDQARASLCLAERVADVIAGARLRLRTQEQTEPVSLLETLPMPVKGIGVAYCVAFQVPGPSLYPAPNAYPPPYEGDS